MSDIKKKEVFALIGDPVGHSASFCMHNAAFKALGIDAVYVPFRVLARDLKRAFIGVRALDIRGLNITIPYKEKCMKFLDKIDKYAQKIGAVNTVLNRDGKLIGYNTDSDGFIDSLKKDKDINPKGKNIFIMGAGGAGRAVSFGLCKNRACGITLVDIKDYKAKRLKEDLSRHYPACNIQSILYTDKIKIKDAISNSDIFVNATGLGLRPDDPSVIDIDFLDSHLLVCDLIYNPPLPPLLKEARKKRLRILNGEGMLLYQAIRAFRLWTKVIPPENIMKKALKSFLKNKPR